MNLPEVLKTFLMWLGTTTAILAIVLAMVMIYGAIASVVDDFKRVYKDKHRFDKPPTAKCYCLRCVHWQRDKWDNTIGYCWQYERNTPDCGFCYFAAKRDYEDRKREKARITDNEEWDKKHKEETK
jgi:hypothetical protein